MQIHNFRPVLAAVCRLPDLSEFSSRVSNFRGWKRNIMDDRSGQGGNELPRIGGGTHRCVRPARINRCNGAIGSDFVAGAKHGNASGNMMSS